MQSTVLSVHMDAELVSLERRMFQNYQNCQAVQDSAPIKTNSVTVFTGRVGIFKLGGLVAVRYGPIQHG